MSYSFMMGFRLDGILSRAFGKEIHMCWLVHRT